MSNRKRVLFLILIMALSSLFVAGITVFSLYRAAISEQRERLVETAQSQARLIEAIARFDAASVKSDGPESARAATLTKIIEAHLNYEQSGRTMEFTLAERKGDSIIFLFTHRHGDLGKLKPIDFDSKLAEPMRRALSGRSGTLVGVDYRGELVLAAHEPVSELNLGIVSKIDLSEIRAPFVKAAAIAGFFSVLVILGGAALFLKISNPLIKLLEEHNIELAVTNKKLRQEIVERTRVEEALRKSEMKYRNIYFNIQDVYFETSPDGIFLEISPSIENFSQYKHEELIGKSLYDVYSDPEETSKVIKEILAKGKVSDYEINLRDKNNSQRPCSIVMIAIKDEQGIPLKFTGSMRDIFNRKQAEKERKDLEEKVARLQKMEALGLLAGGVAHDLNNVLSGIVGYPDLLLMELPQDSPLRNPILNMKSSGQKAADIVQDLLTLARRGVITSDVLNLNDIVKEYLVSPEHQRLKAFHSGVQIETNLDRELLNIKGSPIHLRKTVMNLVSNAAEAQVAGGKITLSTKNQYIDRPIKGYDNIQEGDYVVIEVSDSGIGIAAEELNRIFEPFYTKKVMGRSGTGLGMAVVWGTVQDHRGYIDIESKEGQGTTFYLYFPVTRDRIVEEKSVIPVEAYMGTGQTILIVDDVRDQRELASSMLTKLGFSAKAVSSGEEAIDYLKNNFTALVLLDMIMDPGIDGLDTYRQILKLHPKQKAIIASGFSETKRAKEAQKLGAGQYVKKPYTLEKIGIAVKNELASGGDG
jgi:PAS domain S-box-containing protein